jgi:hypothetical protein
VKRETRETRERERERETKKRVGFFLLLIFCNYRHAREALSFWFLFIFLKDSAKRETRESGKKRRKSCSFFFSTFPPRARGHKKSKKRRRNTFFSCPPFPAFSGWRLPTAQTRGSLLLSRAAATTTI